MGSFWEKRAYAEASTEPADLAKRGLVYLMARKFAVGTGSSVSFNMATSGLPIQFEFYTLNNSGETVYAELIESASATLFGDPIAGRNLNRNFPDTHTATLRSASAVSGGIVVASELFGSAKASGTASESKPHILKPDTNYTMVFTNLSNQSSTCHINLGWSEGEPEVFPLVENTN